ncbi:MAG: imidazolonepropionase [Candidatus Aminicenantaceae bacterium]
MVSADLVVSGCGQLVTCSGPAPKRKQALQDLGVIERGCIASHKGVIVFVGPDADWKQSVRLKPDGVTLDAAGLLGLPGLVDPHTHLPFGGSRENEFRLRIQGATYQELAAQGMGIQSTVDATRSISLRELVDLCLQRLDSMLAHGTTTVEAKSGYGLNLEDEIKQLEALREADRKHPIDIVKTFLGAHEVPREYKARKEAYIDLLTHAILPEVKAKNLAEFFDVFCEEGVYSIDESRQLIRAAKKAGLKIKLHADEFVPLGGAQLAVKEGAVSAEHLIAITDQGIEEMAQSPSAAILLPGVPFFLMQDKKAPARRLIDAGAIVALATDFNPGSSMTESQMFILQLAVFTLHMSLEEAIHAVTLNAAYGIDRHTEVGSLEVGKKMDMVLCDAPNYAYLVYHFGINPVIHVIKNGKIVIRHRQRNNPQ